MTNFIKSIVTYLVIVTHMASIIHAAEQTSDKLTTSHTVTNSDFHDQEPSIRIKDITSIQGVRENFLIGRGLVVGLNGTGDSLSSSPQTKESLVSMLERLGVNVRDGNMSGKNVAMVMVTATLPPFPRMGGKIDIEVSALGDSKSLNGGTLLVTPLQGADGKIYAVAQGKISVSGVAAQGINAQQTKGVPTSGKIANGALIEKEIDYQFADLKTVKLLLTTPDMTTATRIVEAINAFAKAKKWDGNVAELQDMGTILIKLPNNIQPIHLLEEVSHLEVRPDSKAKVVIDENNGVIAMSSKARISPIALTHGSITIKVVEEPKVYFPESSGYNVNSNFMMNSSNNLVNIAQKTTATKTLQAEQLSLLSNQQENEKKQFQKDNEANPNLANLLAQMDARHLQDKNRLQQQFARQLDELSNQVNMSDTGGMSMMPGMMAPGMMPGIGNPGNTGGVTTYDTKLDVKEEKGKFSLLSSGATIEKFVNALNQLGVTVKDMGSILMAIKNAGALHAEIKIS